MPGFPSAPVVADFSTYPNGVVGAPWAGQPTTDYVTDLSVVGGFAGGTGGVGASDLYQDQERPPNQEAWAILGNPVPSAGTTDYWLYLRMSGASGAGYAVNAHVGTALNAGGLIRLYRVAGGARTNITPGSSVARALWTAGDIVGAQAIGPEISVFATSGGAWSRLFTVSDPTGRQLGGFLGVGGDDTGWSILGGGGIANPYIPRRMPLGA